MSRRYMRELVLERPVRSPHLIGAMVSLPEGLLGRPQKEDLFAVLTDAASRRDAGGVSEACRKLVERSRGCSPDEAQALDGRMSQFALQGRKTLDSALLPMLEEAARNVHEECGKKAALSDMTPEQRKEHANRRLLDAAKAGDLEGVKSAVRDGADVRAREKEWPNKTAMDHAFEDEPYFDLWVPKFPEIVDFLRDVMQRGRGGAA